MQENYFELKKQLQKNRPFVLYSKPNSDEIIAYLQQDDNLYFVNDFTEKGFVFVSSDGQKKILIPEIKSIKLNFNKKTTPIFSNQYIIENEQDILKFNFKNLAEKAIKTICDKKLQKVVISRKETVLLCNFDIFNTFNTLIKLYPNAFKYCFFHPKIGIWLGATPEQLLQFKQNQFTTVALAGTQKKTKSIIWQKKEKEEQQFVTDYITNQLQNMSQSLNINQPKSIEAGEICHLKTTISGSLKNNFKLIDVIEALHPTPAVCGVPKKEASDFIIKNEGYNRSFYTGFLGELNLTQTSKTDLFVNLRCIEIDKEIGNLYIGCGITKDSILENEWLESTNKANIIKKALKLKNNNF